MPTQNDVLLEQMQDVIGREAILNLIRAMPGERIRIPTHDEWDIIQARNQRIIEGFYNHGWRWVQENVVPLSKSQIYRIVGAARP